MLREIQNIDSHITWIESRKIDGQGEQPDTYLLVKLEYTDYYLSDDECKEVGKYWISIYAAGSEWPNADELLNYVSTYGMTVAEFQELPLDGQLELLVDTGCAARLWHTAGNNKRKLLADAKRELELLTGFTFGFAMDRTQNAIGATGWDWIKGDITGRLSNA